MALFKLKMDELLEVWQRSYYEIEAETEEEAMSKILDGIEEPYDYETLYTGLEPVEEFEILNSNNEVIYSSKEDV